MVNKLKLKIEKHDK